VKENLNSHTSKKQNIIKNDWFTAANPTSQTNANIIDKIKPFSPIKKSEVTLFIPRVNNHAAI